jgi:sugar (pentulose or hexulose) kinase
MALYLGFDVRSESMTAVVVEIAATRRIAFHHQVTFESPDAWEDALDSVMTTLATAAELDIENLRAVSGAAPEDDNGRTIPGAALLALHPSRPLGPQLRAIVGDDELEAMRRLPRAFFADLLMAPYWRRRYALPSAPVVAWQTTHASTLIGHGIIRPGLILISLGITDTAAGVDGRCAFRNGSLARDWIRLEHRLDEDGFARLLEQRPGNDGLIMLPWLEHETTPAVAHTGLRRFAFDRLDAGRNVRGLVEGQVMALANHAATLTGAPIDRVIVTGAESANRALLQVMANVFGADVYRLEVVDAAALGAALRAYHADRLISGDPVSWEAAVSGFADPHPGHRVTPNPKHVMTYARLRRDYAILERLHKDRRPIC